MADRAVNEFVVGGALFESPRWHARHWWVSDLYRGVVLKITPAGHVEEFMTVEGQPSGLGWMPDGSLLVVSMLDCRVLRRWPGGKVTEHANLAQHCRGGANDMVVDTHGRAYVGTFGFDLYAGADPAPAVLLQIDPDGSVRIAARDLWFPNGSVITPDESTLIVGETAAARYTAFTIKASGELAERRVWAQVAPPPQRASLAELTATLEFAPDGCALDAKGHIWAADSNGARCCRVAPGGGIVEEVITPGGLTAFACMLGGADGRTLLVTAAPAFRENTRPERGEAVLVTTTVDVPHAGLP